VEVDETGKKSGRGAYLCRTRNCWDAGLKKKALEHALKVPISVEDKAALQAYAATLPMETEEVTQGSETGVQEAVSSRQ